MSCIASFKVFYKKKPTNILRAEVIFSLPDNSELLNPRGSVSRTFPISSNNGNDVTMNFIEIKDPIPSPNYVIVERIANITLNEDFTPANKTEAILNAQGTEEGRKSQSGDDYIEDPDKEYGDAQ